MPALLAPLIIELAADWFAVTVSVETATGIAQAVILAATFIASFLLRPTMPKPGQQNQTIKQPISPRQVGFGDRVRLFGSYALYEVNSKGASWDVIAFYHGKLTSIDTYYLNKDVIALDGSGWVQKGNDGRYWNNDTDSHCIRITTRMGLVPETAYADPITFLPVGIWTTDHRGDGIASGLLQSNSVPSANFMTTYPNGPPQLSLVCSLRAEFDPREVGQDINDPTTWVVTNNPVTHLVNFFFDSDIGMGVDFDLLFTNTVAINNTSADYCDVAVLKKDATTEPRYESRGAYYLNNDPVDVINEMLKSFDGWVCPTGDGVVILPGRYDAPTLTIPVEHIISVSAQKGVADEQVLNSVIPQYNEPLADFTMLEGQSWDDTTDIANRGLVRSQQADFAWVQSFSQARRLAKRLVVRSNAPRRGTTRIDKFGFACAGHRYLRLQHGSPASIADIIVEVTKLTFHLNAPMGVSVEWILADPTIDSWNPATDEGDRPPIPNKVVVTQVDGPANVSVTQGSIDVGNGTVVLALNVKMDYDVTAAYDIVVRYRSVEVGTHNPLQPWQLEKFNSPVGSGGTTTVQVGGVKNNTTYEVQVAFVLNSGQQTPWTPWIGSPPRGLFFATTSSATDVVRDEDGNPVVDQDGNVVISG